MISRKFNLDRPTLYRELFKLFRVKSPQLEIQNFRSSCAHAITTKFSESFFTREIDARLSGVIGF